MKVFIDTRKFRKLRGTVDLILVRNEWLRNGVRFNCVCHHVQDLKW